MDNDALYETDDNKKKFQLTRGMLILAAVILVVIIIVIIIIVLLKVKNQNTLQVILNI